MLRLHEEVYTSAAELLDRSSGNLGIVARTRQFPNELELELQSYRGYSLLPELCVGAPEEHPPRFVVGPCRSGQGAYGLTRVGYAGADHTGRTTPLAHHFVSNLGEMQTAGIPPWLLIHSVRGLFHSRWQQPPGWIDPPRTVDCARSPPNGARRSHSQDILQERYKRSLIRAADGLVRYPSRRQPIVICVPTDAANAAVEFIIDVLRLLPLSLQNQIVAVSHVVETTDYVRDAWLMITYPGTPFYERCRQRLDSTKPIIVDLGAASSDDDGLSEFGQTIAKLWQTEEPTDVVAAMRIWDQVGLSANSISLFPKTIALRRRMLNLSSPDQLPELSSKFAECFTALERPAVLKTWSLKLIAERVMSFSPNERARALTTIRHDDRWPAEMRGEAWRGMVAYPDETIPHVLELAVHTGGPRQAEMKTALRSLLAASPEYLSAHLSRTVQSGNANDARHTSVLLTCGSPLLEDLVAACSQLFARDKDPSDVLLSTLITSVESRSADVHGLEVLCRLAAVLDTPPWHVWRYIALPSLLKKWESATSKEVERLAELFFATAMCTQTLILDLQSLLARRRLRITPQMVDSWLRQSATTVYEQDVRQVLSSSGFLKNPTPSRESVGPADLLSVVPSKRPKMGHVGPIGPPMVLATASLTLCVLHLAAWRGAETLRATLGFWNVGNYPLLTQTLLFLVPFGYLVGECAARIWARNSTTFGVVAGFRWLSTFALCAVIAYASIPSVQSWVQLIKSWSAGITT